jgi:hypothetical protein
MLKNFTPQTQIVAIKIVGYTNLTLLGKKTTLKVYKSKASCKVAALKIVAKAKINGAKQFVEDMANILKGAALKAKVWTAKRTLRLKGWSWSNYIALCNAFRLLMLFNNTVCRDLRVSIY